MTSGGKRKGAGRKVERGEVKESLTVRVTPTLRKFIAATDESAADVIEDAVRKTKRFREWMKTRDC